MDRTYLYLLFVVSYVKIGGEKKTTRKLNLFGDPRGFLSPPRHGQERKFFVNVVRQTLLDNHILNYSSSVVHGPQLLPLYSLYWLFMNFPCSFIFYFVAVEIAGSTCNGFPPFPRMRSSPTFILFVVIYSIA